MMASESPAGKEKERVAESRAAQIATRKLPAATGVNVTSTEVPGSAVMGTGFCSRTIVAPSGSANANRLTDRERRPAKNVNFLFLGLLLGIPR